MAHKTLNRIFATLTFLLGLGVYLKTMAPSVSFWDCGEFIACALKLQIPHPPGAPIYLLVGRIFTMLPDVFFDNVAQKMNFLSVLSSALTLVFLQLTIVYLIREYVTSDEGFLRYVPHLGGFIGAMSFAFSHSFWFNAVEAEVYAPSMFFTSILVWLVFRWRYHAEERGNERYLILMAYVMGLAMGVHILTVLVVPALVLVVYFRRYTPSLRSFLIMGVIGMVLTATLYPGVVIHIPSLANLVGFGGLAVFIVLLMLALYFFYTNRQSVPALVLVSFLLVIVGYSAYMMIYIRSGLDPSIDENDPETLTEFISYINREQYGDHHLDREKRRQESPAGNEYEGAWDFFWTYQIKEMYVRYFLWNFGGIADTEGFSRARIPADPGKFLYIPLLLGFAGAIYHFQRDWKHAFVVFALFFMTGFAIVLYLNQPDPQPRERDYSYVGSFYAFSIWIGIGAAALLEIVAERTRKIGGLAGQALPAALAILIFVLCPLRMFAENIGIHDRTGNFVARDYSYNMLISCDPNAVMFTNGDNDTFPLWYLQEVENVRTDVRVANLSLLNTPWYIEQLKHKEPTAPISFTDEQINNINLQPWPERRVFEIPTVPDEIQRAEADRYRLGLGGDPETPDNIRFEVRPKMYFRNSGGGRQGVLRVQDLMILNILSTNQFRQPIYFAVTASDQNRMDGLKDYQRMDGLLFRVTTIPNWEMDPITLYDNLMNKFRYTNLNNPDVYYNDNTIGLLQNYRSAFFRLATHYLEAGDMETFSEVMVKLNDVMPASVIPYTNRQFGEVMESLSILGGAIPMDSLTADNYSLRQIQSFGEVAFTYKQHAAAAWAFRILVDNLEAGDSVLVQDYVRSFFRRPEFYEQATAQQRDEARQTGLGQIRRQLVRSYREAGMIEEGIAYLNQWLAASPEDSFARNQLAEFEQLRAGQ